MGWPTARAEEHVKNDLRKLTLNIWRHKAYSREEWTYMNVLRDPWSQGTKKVANPMHHNCIGSLSYLTQLSQLPESYNIEWELSELGRHFPGICLWNLQLATQ